MKNLYIETGKYLYDISKIILGLAIVTPMIKDEQISVFAILLVVIVFSVGAVLIKKGE